MAAVTPSRGEIVHNPDNLQNSGISNFHELCNTHAEKLYRAWSVGNGITMIGMLSSSNPGTYQRVGEHLDIAQSVLSITRSITMIVKIFSGGILWTNEKKPVMVGDKPKITWDSDGNSIHHYTIKCVQRDPLDILCDIFLAVARILNPLLWLNKLGIIDLGKHAAPLGIAVGASFAATTTVCLVDAGRNLSRELNKPKGDSVSIRKRVAEVFCSIADMLAIPADCGFSFSASPEMALASACCKLASGVIWCISQMIYS